MMKYFGHDLYNDRLNISPYWFRCSPYWFRCSKCKIRLFYNEFFQCFYDSTHSFDNITEQLTDITCDEYIIKNIIE